MDNNIPLQSSVDLIRRVKDMDNNIPLPLILVSFHIDTYNNIIEYNIIWITIFLSYWYTFILIHIIIMLIC
jgi:hypothetical protein